MEFVGKSVKKEFKGHGVFSGIVQSYDASSGFFEIVYEDGDSEELDFNEVASLFDGGGCGGGGGGGVAKAEPSRLGRKPKRRRVQQQQQMRQSREIRGISGNESETLDGNVLESNVVDLNDGFVENLRESDGVNGNFVDLNNGFVENLNVNVNVNVNGEVDLRDGIDLNAGFNFKLNDGIHLDVNYAEDLMMMKKKNNNNNERECFDLNLDVNVNGGDMEENMKVVETRKRECCFDLNLGVDDNEDSTKCEEQVKEFNDLNVVVEAETMEGCSGVVEGVHVQGGIANGTLVEVHVAEDSSLGFVEGLVKETIVSSEDFKVNDYSGVELKEGVSEPGSSAVVDGCQGYMGIAYKPGRGRRRKRNVSDGMHVTMGTAVYMAHASDAVQSKEGDPRSAVVDGCQGDMGSASKPGRGRRKKRNVLDSMDGTTGTAVYNAHDSNGVQLKEGVSEPGSAVIDGCQGDVGSAYKKGRGRRKSRKVLDSMDVTTGTMCGDTNIVSGEDNKAHGSDGVQLREGVSGPNSAAALDGYQGDTGSEYKQGRGRRIRKVEENVNVTMEMGLRRSARRGSSRNNVSSTTLDDVSSSPGVSAVTEERLEEPIVLPPKLQLPPSSQNLDLDGIPVLDVFSIYACLRSFSTLLFLSPFDLEDFVAALKCNSPSTVFDCIHVSILQTLRKHLEYLSNEGSESASNCLRSLNWDLLDLITWPIFMVEYLLIHGSGLRPGFDLSQLKLLKNDYYKQPASVKVEILRCLCDDMIEVEAIRLELSRRSSASEPDIDFDRNVSIEVYKKRRATMDVSGGSCLTEDIVLDTIDWNSDECRLCRMDGSLICCDGCPAAYHSKCVGVANDLLPEGDWYCPECAIDRHKPWMKPRKSLRGAELLGIDPHGQLFFNSCGYLLVSDSCDTEFSFNYYHRNDLNTVIDVLKSSDIFYSGIIKAIYKQWEIPVGLNGILDSQNTEGPDMLMKEQSPAVSIPLACLASSGMCADKNQSVDERKLDEKSVVGYSDILDFGVSKSLNLLDSVTAMEISCINSEGAAEATQMSSGNQIFQKQGSDFSNRSNEHSNQSERPEKSLPLGNSSLTSTSLDMKEETDKDFAAPSHVLSAVHKKNGDTSQVPCGTGYMNYYSFAQTASSVVEELTHKPLDKTNEESIKSEEEILSRQMKAILKNSNKFYWPDIQNLNVDALKEKCGWCFSCKGPSDDMDCLFKMNTGLIKEVSNSEVVGLQSKRNKKGHIVDVICHILSIEDRLHGLLLGPWLNPHYTKLCRKSVLKASDIVSLKHLLFTLESNLHSLALSAEWLKHVDSVVKVGSATHIVIASSRTSLKHGIGRKRTRGSDVEINSSSNAAGGLGICWWRGGRLSRKVFSWKVLPRSLVSKAARQAGSMKIPGILYPESSDFAKRSKCVAWQAAVESSTSVEQLAFQVRELDSNIRWNDIENTHHLSVLDKESRKSIRLFKKAIIRRKCIEGGVKYLLDFGKRRIIPGIVVKQGTMVEKSSSERKKYWLNESYVPLHLLKNFEEKRIARKFNKMSSGKLAEASRVMKKSSKKRGFSYLFSKAERSEYYQCGHCNKDVLVREAVCCQYCKGFFHKRHIRKSAGAITAECTYTCHRCQEGKLVKNDTRTGKSKRKRGKIYTKSAKVQSQKSKKASTTSTARRSMRLKNSKKLLVGARPVRSQSDKKAVASVPLRRSPRKVKFMPVEKKKIGKCKKGKQKSKKTPKKPEKVTSWQKKRTQAYHSCWINGLLLSRKPDDERVMQFRRKSFVAPSEHLTVTLDLPKCFLCCEAGHTSALNYIACEICGEWFHGDAFGLNVENISKLIGFRCHVCCKRTPPVCPHMLAMRTDGSQSAEGQNNVRIECSDEVCNAVPPPSEVTIEQQSHSNEEGLFPLDECLHKEHLGTILDMDQSFMSESKLEVENGPLHVDSEHDTNLIQISNEDLKADLLTTSSENLMLEDNRINSGGNDVTITSHDGEEPHSCKVDGDVIDTELASFGHDKAKDNLVKTKVIQELPVDGAVVDSVELRAQTLIASGELLDEERKLCRLDSQTII